MNIKWQGKKCILCGDEANLTTEHIIPKALGGILTCNFLCNVCNSKLGKSFEAAARLDPSIRIAAENLQSEIPNLSVKLLNNQAFFGKGPGGRESGIIRNGKFRVKSRKDENGSFIQPSDTAYNTVKKLLLKKGSKETKNALHLLKEAPANEKVQISQELEIVKYSIEKVEFNFNSNTIMSPLVPLKIAFEFLACHLGSVIYEDNPQISDYRKVLSESIEEHACFKVDRLTSQKCEAFHGICFEDNRDYAQVQIMLFGWLRYRVHFFNISIAGPKCVYTHCLESNKEDFQLMEK
jgi:hypothetical protein